LLIGGLSEDKLLAGDTAAIFGLDDLEAFLAAAALVLALVLLAAIGGVEIVLAAPGVATVVHCQSPSAETQA